MSNDSVFKMNLSKELEFFKLRLEKIDGSFAKKITVERCNQLIRGAKAAFRRKVKACRRGESKENNGIHGRILR